MSLIAIAAAATAAQLAQAFVESRAVIAGVAVATAAALAWRGRSVSQRGWTIALAVVCALACTRSVVAPSAAAHVVALLDGSSASARERTIEARVADVAPSGRSGVRWLVDAVSIEDPQPRSLDGRLLLYVRSHAPTISAGARVRFTGRLRRITAFGNPGELDWVGWNARRGVFVSAFVWDGREIVVLGHGSATLADRVADLRARVTSAAARDRGRGGALVAALITGERTLLSEADSRAVSAAGLAHVLAISGLNLSLAGGGVFWLVHRLLLTTAFARAGVDIARGAAVAAVAATLGYTAISGGGVSVARAALTALIAAAASWQGRRGSGISALAAAAVSISLAMPGVAREAGFQLSFAAVVAILAYGPAVGQRKRRPSAARQAVEISFLCWAVSTPILVQHFGRLTVYGAPATLMTAPLATMIVAAGLAGAAAVATGQTGCGDLFFAVGAWAAEWLLRTAHGFAALPAADLRVVQPGPVAAAAAALAPFSLLLNGRVRRAAALGAVAVIVIAGATAAHERYRDDALDVYFLSVGQGDSTVVRFPGGRIAVIDAGLPGRGAMVVAPFLRRLQVRRIDYLVATHAQDDHAGGLVELLDEFVVGELWTAAGRCEVESFAHMREAARARGVRIVEVGGTALPARSGDAWRIAALWPRDADGACGDNDRSVVLAAEFAGRRLLLSGDIEAPAERALVATVNLDSDVINAPHHGSRTSSSAGFVAATSPVVVVASAGQGNHYGFPRAETESRFLAAGARFLTTAIAGAVHVRIGDDGRLDVRTTTR